MPGPGRISVISQTKSHLTALLYDFDVNSPQLKGEHIQWLTKNIPQYSGRNMSVVIIGLASRTGTDRLNWDLSKRRAQSVSVKIFSLAPSMYPETNVAFGEEAARITGMKDRVEDGRWRAVLIAVLDPKTPPLRPGQRRRR